MEKIKNLNPRQWDLYNFLKANYADGIYISKLDIAKALPQHYEVTKTTRLLRAIESDIRAINECVIIQKIIVSNKTGYKVGNEAEVREYLNKRFKRDLKNLKLNWDLSRKVAMDGQMRLVFGSERDTIESYPR